MWVYSVVLSGNAPEVKFESGPKLNFKYRLCSLLRHELKPSQALQVYIPLTTFHYVILCAELSVRDVACTQRMRSFPSPRAKIIGFRL